MGSSRFPPLLLLIAVCTVFSAAGTARAQQGIVAVLPGCGNVDASLILGARSQLVRVLGTRLRVTDMDRRPQVPLPPLADVMRLGQALHVPIVLVFRIEREGIQTTVLIFGFASATGAPVLAVQQSTTSGPEALPGMIDRLAHQILSKLTGTENRALGFVRNGTVPFSAPAPPSQPVAPVCVPPAHGTPHSQNGVGARLGLFMPVGSAGPTPAVMSSIAVGLSADRMSYLFDAMFEYGAADDAHLTSLGAGVYLPFDEKQSTYYLGVQLKMTHFRLGGQGQQGLMGMPVVGYLMNRFEIVRIRVEGGYFFGIAPREKSEDRLFPGSGTERSAHGAHVSLGVWF